MSAPTDLLEILKSHFAEDIVEATVQQGEVTLEIAKNTLHSICIALRDQPSFWFETLIDICGVDYQDYGRSEWMTESATRTGFERGVGQDDTLNVSTWNKPRFAAVYHLLSLKHNHRLRLRSFAVVESVEPDGEELPILDSVTDIWPAANWYEREAFDLYGIQFKNHPDQRRLLTDYDFEGHPFRKDFPLIGKVEVRYDAASAKVIYEPVTSVTPRIVIPKVIRLPHEVDTSPLQKTTEDA
jgi:NADH-quinone oxidoreductase subunit C